MTHTPAEPPTVVTSQLLRDWALPQPEGSKHSRGHVLVVGGSASTPGAAMLAGIAALRVGAGVLALAVADSVAGQVAVAIPEAAVTGLPQLDGGAADDALGSRLAGSGFVLLGPGLDETAPTTQLLETTVRQADDRTRFVLDAFALGVLAGCSVRDELAGRTILTPNTSEAERLLDGEVEDSDAAEIAARIADEYESVVTYQGCVADPGGGTWRVAAGHPGLGTCGSGDVLAGAVVGLLARGADAAQAACWATYLHAVAGERLAARVGRLGFLARELAAQLPVVLTETEA